MHQSQDKIARLEQEKEHWLLEAQLGKVRLEKESQRIGELEAQLAAAGAAARGAPVSVTAATAVPPADASAHDQEDEEVVSKGSGTEPTTSTSLVRPPRLTTPPPLPVGQLSDIQSLLIPSGDGSPPFLSARAGRHMLQSRGGLLLPLWLSSLNTFPAVRWADAAERV